MIKGKTYPCPNELCRKVLLKHGDIEFGKGDLHTKCPHCKVAVIIKITMQCIIKIILAPIPKKE